MRILQKLLDNLGDLWNTLPKEIPLFTIEKGSGAHSMVTVDGGMMYLHSSPFHPGIPQRQEVCLDKMTAEEFVDTLQGMGYVVQYTSEALEHGLNVHKPFILIEIENAPLTATLTSYTSNLWQIMYPIYRVLRDVEFDTSEALKALYRSLADGEWLDFWADFFAIKREPGESDNDFSRRFTMWLFNPKTNNVALEELLAYRLQDTNIEIRDRGPLQFELIVGTKYINDASDLHRILRETKGAGIEYFLRYQSEILEEFYPVYWSDAHGMPFTHMDGGQPSMLTLFKPFDKYEVDSEEGMPAITTGAEDAFPTPVDEFLPYQMARIMEEHVSKALESVLSELAATYEETASSGVPAVFDDFSQYDNHNRIENTTTGTPWDIASAGVVFTGNAYAPGGTSLFHYAEFYTSPVTPYSYVGFDCGMTDYVFEVLVGPAPESISGTSRISGTVMFRFVDSDNYMYLDWINGNMTYPNMEATGIALYKRENGVDTLLATAMFDTPDHLTVSVPRPYRKLRVIQKGAHIGIDYGSKRLINVTDATFYGSTKLGLFIRYGHVGGKDPVPIYYRQVRVAPTYDLSSIDIVHAASEAYKLPPESNLNISFETNSSETRGEHELLAPSSLQQDVAAITITVDGNIVETIIV